MITITLAAILIIVIGIVAVAVALGGITIVTGLVIGIPVLIFALIVKLIIAPTVERNMINRLNENHIQITPQKFKLRTENKKNGSFYVIDCYYTDSVTQREFVFSTKPFVQNPSAYMSTSFLTVFADPEDYSNYIVDTQKINIS